jgi:hypothetical protein
VSRDSARPSGKGKRDEQQGQRARAKATTKRRAKYNEATKKFVDSGKVDQAARDAAPRDAGEADRDETGGAGRLAAGQDSPPVKEPTREPPSRSRLTPKDQRKRDASSH